MRIYPLHVSVRHSSLQPPYSSDKLIQDIERDSAKDQAVVIIFIIATVGLLGYAIASPWVSKWVDVGCTGPLATPSDLDC